MDRNSEKWSQKCYHSLPFAVKVSFRRSFEQFHNLNNRQRSFPYHSIPTMSLNMPFLYKLKVFWPRVQRVETRLLIAFSYRLELLTQAANFEDTNSLSPSFLWNDEGKQAVKTKAECFKAWRLFLLSSLFLSNMHYWPSVRSIWLDIWPNSLFFFILLDVLKVLYFFLVGYATRLLRSLAARPHALKLVSLTFKNLWKSTFSKSSFLFTETKSANEKKNDANIQLSWPPGLDRTSLVNEVFISLPNYRGFIHNGFSCCYLVFYE